MAEKIKIKTKKGGKKDFYDVEAPMTAVKISLYGSSAEDFDGQVVTLDLTKSLRGKSLELKMRINNVDGKLKAEPISINLLGSYVRRSMRRGADYVEDSFNVNCKDAKIVVKPFMITRRRVSRAVRRALRINARKFLEGHLKIRMTKEVFSDIIANKIQRGMALKLKKIYPLAFSEIRFFGIIGERDVNVVEEVGVDEAEVEEKEEIKKELKAENKVKKKSSKKEKELGEESKGADQDSKEDSPE